MTGETDSGLTLAARAFESPDAAEKKIRSMAQTYVDCPEFTMSDDIGAQLEMTITSLTPEIDGAGAVFVMSAQADDGEVTIVGSGMSVGNVVVLINDLEGWTVESPSGGSTQGQEENSVITGALDEVAAGLMDGPSPNPTGQSRVSS